MYQKVIIVGRLGRDPEMRYGSNGKAVTSFSVATDRSWTDQSGQRQERTTWFRVSVWGAQAEACNQYLAKGRTVLVEGEVQEPRVWQDRDGNHKASLELTARNVRFLGKSDGQGQQAQEQGAAAPQGQMVESGAVLTDEYGSDVPF